MKSQVNTQLLETSLKVIAPPLPFKSPDPSPKAALLTKRPVKLLLSVVLTKTIAPPVELATLESKLLLNLLLFALS